MFFDQKNGIEPQYQHESPRLQQKARREETLEPGRQVQSVPLLRPRIAAFDPNAHLQVRTKYRYHHILLAGPPIFGEGKTGKHPLFTCSEFVSKNPPDFHPAQDSYRDAKLQTCIAN